MVNWERINNKTFEALAYEYISSKYPDLNWTSTKATRDGNKDGESIYIAPLGIAIKYWYEAKYSKTTDKSIPKSHLDSTLVSCLLDGKVAFIAFITNAYISDDYRRRADVFAKQQDNLKIIYINGGEIEEWLCDNPDIEIKYFETNTAQHHDIKDNVKDFCILQNYDLCGNHFTKVKNIECGKEYILYISFYSTCMQTASLISKNRAIELISNGNRQYDRYDELHLVDGFNSIYIPIRINALSDERLLFTLSFNNGAIDFIIDDVSIIDIYNPRIIYGSQIEIENSLFSLINDRDITNAVFYILGDAGVGKSYLLNNIYNNSRNPFSSYVISFTGDEQSDTINCYRMIIISLYGDIWEYMDGSDLYKLSEIELLMIQQIKEKKLISSSINQVSSYYKANKNHVEKNVSQTQILIDDFHKLSDKNISLLMSFYQWFINQRYNCKIFIFSRTEIDLPPYYTKRLVIKNLEPQDVESTIHYNFNNLSFLPNLIKKYPTPLNALHFINILCEINNVKDDLEKNSNLESQILLNNIYSNSEKLTCLSFGNQIISKYKNNKIVYCVYKIKTGISLEALLEYFSEDCYDEIYDLCQKRIIKESSNMLLPYHDILVSAFDTINTPKMNKKLESFILFAQQHDHISQSKMFSVLIGIGKKCFWKYRKEAGIYRDELHEIAEYYQALEIAQKLNESNSKRLDDYDLEDCKNLFVIANCIKYTSSYEMANIEFEKIRNIYEMTKDPNLYGLSLEAETEIINNLIWMLDIISAKKRLDDLTSIVDYLYLNKLILDRHMIYAFLNYYNRLMFANYMLDEGSERDYNNAVKYSMELGQIQYEAFAKMDYAKSLYGINLNLAQELIDQALDLLDNNTEKRRRLDAESEKHFINDILNKTISYEKYSCISQKMQKNHYIQSVVKIQLKIIMLELLCDTVNPNEIRSKLATIAVNNPTIASGKRHQLFINHLYAASYYKENNISASRTYSLKCKLLVKNMGKSYQYIHDNNSVLTNWNGFMTLNEIESMEGQHNLFILDIRLW